MEFLPPDVTPLHDPSLQHCKPAICLDPRRSAEDVCAISLGKMTRPNSLHKLTHDIEQALNNPDAYQMPDIAERGTQVLKATGSSVQRLHARTLIATAPLFELRARHEVSDAEMHTSYIALSGLASLLRKKMNSPFVRGTVAEIAIHAALLRGGRNVPYLTSRREEASNVSVLNNDLGAYDSTTGHMGKVPLQIKRTSKGNKAYIENRVLPIVANKLFTTILEPYPQLRREDEDAVDTVFRIMAQEKETRNGHYLSKSPSGKVLAGLSDALNETIDHHRQWFEDAAYAQGVRSLVSAIFADKPGVATRANLRASRFVQAADGEYIFFNSVTAVRREDQAEPHKNEYRVSFGYGAHTIASLSCTGSSTLTTTVLNSRPGRLPKELFRDLATNIADIPWENA